MRPPSEWPLEVVEAVFTAREEYLQAALTTIENDFDSFDPHEKISNLGYNLRMVDIVKGENQSVAVNFRVLETGIKILKIDSR